MSIADRLVALDQGVVLAQGAPSEVLADPAVVASYLGTTDAVIARSGPHVAAASIVGAATPAVEPT